MSERLYTAREILEKERDELRDSLSQKVQQGRRIEESLREQLLHKGKRVPDQGFDGLLKAFDLYEDTGPKLASKQTQTDNSQMIGVPIAPTNLSGNDTSGHRMGNSKQMYMSVMPVPDNGSFVNGAEPMSP